MGVPKQKSLVRLSTISFYFEKKIKRMSFQSLTQAYLSVKFLIKANSVFIFYRNFAI